MPSDPASFYHRSGPDDPVTAASSPRSAYLHLLGNRNFRYWFASSFTSSVGDWMGFVALTALMTQLYDESSSQLFAVGGLLMIRLLPSAMFGPIAGVIADRYDRRKVLVFTDMARAAVFLVIAFAGDVLAIFALTFIVECIALLFLAAKDASLPQVVDEEHLTEANQLNLLCSYGTLPLGAVSTSVMIAVAALMGGFLPGTPDPLRLALLFNAVSFFLSGLLLFRVHLPGEANRRRSRIEAEDPPGILAELREGLAFIRGFPLLRALISGIVGVFFGAGVVIGLGPVFVRSELGQPAANWSILLSAVGGGLLVGIVVVVPLLRRFTQEKAFPIMLALTGLLAGLTAMSVNFPMVLAVGSVLGASAGVAVVQGYTLLQTHTEDATRARTFSLFYVLTRMSLFAALGIGPFIAGFIGRLVVGTSQGVFVVTGVRITLVAGALIALWSGLRARSAIAAALRDRDTDRPLDMGKMNAKPATGLFISFEGVEGAGKSTQIRLLAEQLEEEGLEVVVTREPGGSPLAERIRDLVLDPATDEMADRTEALLIAAARADHVAKTIKPALESGKVVLSDRFVDSSLAYQGYGRGLGPDDVLEVNRWAVDGVMPDVVVLLQLDPDEGMQRVLRRAVEPQDGGRVVPLPNAAAADRSPPPVGMDRMEQLDAAFHRRVAKGFLDLARAERDRFVIVDAQVDADSLHRQVRAALHRWIPLPYPETPADGTPVADDEFGGDTAVDGRQSAG